MSKSISQLLTEAKQRDPNRPAITHEGQTINREQLDLQSNRLARDFANRGVHEGDLVTIALPNCIDFYLACIAAWKLGATPQPVSAKLPEKEQQEIVALAKPAILVGADPDNYPGIETLAPGYQPGSYLSDTGLPEKISASWKAPTSGGSTGRPKIIVCNAPGAFDFDRNLPAHMQSDKTHLVTGPLYHNGPLTFSIYGLLLGNHLILRSRFDALTTLELIDKYQIDWMMLVPTMMLRISRLGKEVHKKFDLSSLRIIMHMAAPCPPWLKEEWINWFGPGAIHELFGATEGTGGTAISGTEWLNHRGSVGKPTAMGKVKAVGENGNDLPPGEIGELYWLPASGPGTTYKYIGAEPELTIEGWETQGDMGHLDEDGYVYLSDRKTDMILSGGANIYPAEVEAAIEAHPAVRTCAVIGLPDEDMGQLPHGIVNAEGDISAGELLEFLAEKLVRYKIPRTVEFVDQALRDEAGKVRRSALLKERTRPSN